MKKAKKITKHKRVKDSKREGKLKPNRQYKDSVFVDLFSLDEKTRDDAVMTLYNALHEDKITSKEQIRFVRLKNLLFREVHNDVSFVVGNKLLILLEHQSTVNENMPFRFLEYVVAMYQLDIEKKDKFSNIPLSLFTPEFYVIYNGKDPYPARKELLLSKLFKYSEKPPRLELSVTVININHPDNKDFLLLCPFLNEYKQLVDEVEGYLASYGEDGFAFAIEACIKKGILFEYLTRKTKEVTKMFSAEHSYALQLKASMEDGRKQGIKQGKKQGRKQGIKEGIKEGIERGIVRGKEENTIFLARSFRDMGVPLEKIAKATGLDEQVIASL